ncbi:hypothetical protein BBJ28_00009812, partial [Nothophytophthora sp. Chile5]
TKASFDTKQLRVDADRHRYFADQISKAERRMQVKQQCMQLEGQAAIKRLGAEAEARSPPKTLHLHDQHHRRYDVWDVELQEKERAREILPECQPDKHRSRRLPLLSHQVADKYVELQASSPTMSPSLGRKLQPQGQALGAGGRASIRHFHATQHQPWMIPVGLACAGLFVGTRYILRAQERVRRRRAGLPEDDQGDEDGTSDGYASANREMRQVLGVDVGSANLRVATASLLAPTSAARVIESADGLRATPAAVAVDNGSVSVGAIAKSLLGRKPGYTATATRLLLGEQSREVHLAAWPFKQEELAELLQRLPYPVLTNADTLELELDGKTYSPEVRLRWAAEIMLDHLHATAASSLGEDPIDNFPAVVSVPAGTDEHDRAAYEKVATSAGFTVFAAIDEPVAALHDAERWASEELGSSEALSAGGPIAVFDLGGYTSSISVVEKERHGGGFRLLHTASSQAVSGHVIDDLLFRVVVDKFREQHNIDLSVDYMASYRILEAVEAAKIELSSRRSTDINLPFITADQTGAKHLVHKVSTFDLARVQEGPAREALALCDRVLATAGVSKQELTALVLIGGGSRSEFMRSQLETFFNRSAFETKNFRPEEAVVLGAAEYGRKLVQE